ncbi:Alpha/Beta hydrolase protein [Syncephalis plumigaleata]|nr:Alpha/Beta hydrolase protein [Syncephalis plumigaleata]
MTSKICRYICYVMVGSALLPNFLVVVVVARVRQSSVSPAAIQRLQVLASYAGATSCDVRGWDCGLHCDELTTGTYFITDFFDQETNTYAYIVVNHRYRRIVVAFRGSVNLASWVQNINALQMQATWIANESVLIHRGFAYCYDRIEETMRTYSKYPVTFVGHSLGGALATLAAVHLRILEPSSTPPELVTYGEPRVGNAAFADLPLPGQWIFPSPLRVVNFNDIVARLPPILLNYQHHNTELWISTAQGDQSILCSSSDDSDNSGCSATVVPLLNVFNHNHYFGISMGDVGECKMSAPISGQINFGLPIALANTSVPVINER